MLKEFGGSRRGQSSLYLVGMNNTVVKRRKGLSLDSTILCHLFACNTYNETKLQGNHSHNVTG